MMPSALRLPIYARWRSSQGSRVCTIVCAGLTGADEAARTSSTIVAAATLSLSADGRFFSPTALRRTRQSVLDRKSGVSNSVGAGANPMPPRGPTRKSAPTVGSWCFRAGGRLSCGHPRGYDVYVQDLLTHTTGAADRRSIDYAAGESFEILFQYLCRWQLCCHRLRCREPRARRHQQYLRCLRQRVRAGQAEATRRSQRSGGRGRRSGGIQQYRQQSRVGEDWQGRLARRCSRRAISTADIRDEVIAGIPGRGLVSRDYKVGLWQQLRKSPFRQPGSR